MKVFKIEKPIVYNYFQSGFFSFICRDDEIIAQITPRRGVCLKVFFTPLVNNDIDSYWWGHPFMSSSNRMSPRYERAKLVDAVKIQNLVARHDLAPRVYDIVGLEVEGRVYPTLVVDDLGESSDLVEFNFRQSVIEKITKIGEKYGFRIEFPDIGQAGNFIRGKFVDFQGFVFEDDYKKRVIDRYKTKAKWSENTYQSVPELGIEGYRDNTLRVQLMKLDKLDFTGKSIIDIGCSGGFYCRYAHDRGASRVLGVDLPQVIESTFEMTNYLGKYNVDFVGMELQPKLDYKFGFAPDIIFFLSMYRYLEYAPFLKMAETVIYEHNGDVPEKTAIDQFKGDFSYVYDLGDTGSKTGSNDPRHTIIFSKKELKI